MTTEEITRVLKGRELKKFGVKSLSLFGSTARGLDKPES